ncbi:DNRLRE domain-containing protein [Nocardioides sp. YJ-D4]
MPVEDLSQRSESERVFANPDGTWTSETTSEPTQVQDGAAQPDGTAGWNLIDPTLVEIPAAAGGGWRTNHAVAKQTFTSGGTDWFASMTQGGHELRFGLDGDLAEGGTGAGAGDGEPVQFGTPVVSENTAVYKDIVADESWSVDLVVRASGIGFEHWWVLNPVEPPATSSSTSSSARSTEDQAVKVSTSITDLDLGLTVTDVTAQKSSKVDPVEATTTDSGGIRILTAKGKSLLQAPGPLYWDATTAGPDEFDPAAKALKAHGKKAPKRRTKAGEPAEEGHVHKAKTSARTVTKGGKATGVSVIGLGIPAQVLESAAGAGPVTVDPSFTVDPNADTWIQTPDYTTSQVTSEELRVGTNDSGGRKARSYLKFDGGNNQWAGKQITSATLRLRNFYSGSCTGSAIRVSRLTSNWDLSGLTWGNQPNGATTTYADSSTARGFSASCPAADVTWNLTSMVQAWADGTANYGLRLMALNETVNSSWRRYRSANYATTSLHPTLSVTYNRLPNKPEALFVTPSRTGLTSSLTPTLSTVLSDPDGGQVRGNYEVWEGAPGTGTSIWSWTASSTKASGSTVSAVVPSGKLVEGHSYTVRGRAYDGTDYGPWSDNTTAKVDVTAPTFAVTSAAFTDGQWRTDNPGTPTTFHFTGPDEIRSYSVLEDGVGRTWVPANSTGDASLLWHPADGPHTLRVSASDPAGNSRTVEFSFGVGAAGFSSPSNLARSTGVFPLKASGPPSATGAEVSWRYPNATNNNAWTSIDGDDLSTTSGSAWDGSVTQANGGSTTPALTWEATAQDATPGDATDNKLITGPAMIELRTCFTYSGTPSQVCTSPRSVELVPSGFGGNFPTTELGGANLALFTGEAAIAEPDAVDKAAGVGRTYSTLDGASLKEGSPAAFGPGWSTQLLSEADTSADIVDHRTQDGTLVLVSAGNSSQMFTAKTPGTNVTSPTSKVTFIPAGLDDGSVLVLDPTVSPATITLTRPENGPITTWRWDTTDPNDAGWALKETDPDGSSGGGTEVAFDTDGAYPTWIAQTEAGVSTTCTATTQEAGCRGLKLSYTGTGANKRVTKIDRLTVNPDGTTATQTQGTYTYATIDSISLLTRACGPDPDGSGSQNPLCTDYEYDTTTMAGRVLLSKITPPGQKAWRYSYDSTGRLTTVKRAYDADTNTATGDAVWSVLYDLAPTTTGLPNLSASEAAKWGQDHLPVKAFAVFGPDAPARDTSHLDWARMWWTDETGAVTNTAVHGNADGTSQWLVDSRWYDDHGNVVQALDAVGRAVALAETTLENQQTAARDAASLTVYNNDGDDDAADGDGRRVEASYGPAHIATLKDGTTGTYRSATTYTYDDEAPNLGGSGKPTYTETKTSFDLVVETRDHATTPDITGTFDEQVTRTEYAALVNGDENGWETGTATRVQRQTTSGNWQDIEISRRDASGRQIETRQPGGNANADGSGADAHSTVFSYYTRGNSDPDCNITGHPERAQWDGLACKTAPAAQPAGTPIPATYNSDYNTSLLPTSSVETSGNVTRTTTTSYDQLGRATSTKTQVVGSGAEADTVEAIISHDPASGLPATQTNPVDSSQIATTYDTWGRPWTYTDAGDNQSVTTYTATGQVATFNDGTGTYATTYNGTPGEHRGLPTSIDLGITSAASDTLELKYNAAGATSQVRYPNGMAASYTYDPGTRKAVAVDYTGADSNGDPIDLAAFAATTDVDGQVIGYASPASTQKFSFDSFGHLTKTEDTRENGCTTRTYGFSPASERISGASYNPATGNPAGACQTDNPDYSRTRSYDSANRVTNSGYTYDNLARVLSVPTVDADSSGTGPLQISYRANDMVKAMTQQVQTTATDGTTTTRTDGRTYVLDPAGRITSITATTNGTLTSRTLYEYPGDSDSPSNISTTSNGGQTWTSQRNVAVPGLGMIASVIGTDTTWQITNLHGDTVASVSDPVTAGITQYSETDEFGRALTGGNTDRYGYLGSQQRSAGGDTLAGIVLMGARLYNPATGSFLSPDGVLNGTENSYSYPSDPINKTDPSGMFITAQSVYLGKGYSSWWRQYYRTWTEALNDNWFSDFSALFLQWYFGNTYGTWLGEAVKLGFRFRWKHKKYRQYGYHNGVWSTRLKYKYYLTTQPFTIYYVKRWLRWRYGKYAIVYLFKMTTFAYSWKSKPVRA